MRALGHPADDPELAEIALDAARTLMRVPPEQLVPHVAPMITALANRFSVTGGDAALDRAAEVLARIEPSALAAALEGMIGARDETARLLWLRELDGLALACPALSPVLASLTPRPPARDAAFEAEVGRFGPYVDAFLAALAEKSAIGSLGAYKAVVRARLRSPRVFDRYHALDWAALAPHRGGEERDHRRRRAQARAERRSRGLLRLGVQARRRGGGGPGDRDRSRGAA
ncbi:hypothetical protein [Nannocystis pusilla]|uniref:hypothetical protein n=1 Tax=Nannocystis pusilla TaxID=889268 RepID=UPI003B80FB50